MATNTYKILGQVQPSKNTLSNIYVTGAATETVISGLTVNNLDSSNASFSIVIRPINQSLSNSHYIMRGISMPPNDILTMTLGITLNSNFILACNTNGTLAFSSFGVELT